MADARKCVFDHMHPAGKRYSDLSDRERNEVRKPADGFASAMDSPKVQEWERVWESEDSAMLAMANKIMSFLSGERLP